MTKEEEDFLRTRDWGLCYIETLLPQIFWFMRRSLVEDIHFAHWHMVISIVRFKIQIVRYDTATQQYESYDVLFMFLNCAWITRYKYESCESQFDLWFVFALLSFVHTSVHLLYVFATWAHACIVVVARWCSDGRTLVRRWSRGGKVVFWYV